jgi:starch synthase (maltosyl-transferring)
VTPALADGGFAVKRTVGSAVTVEADIYMDGHETLRAVLLWRRSGQRDWREAEMAALGNDRWSGTFPLHEIGRHEYTIAAWRDLFGTWHEEVEKKHAAGLELSAELAEGRQLLSRAAARAVKAEAVGIAAWIARADAAGDAAVEVLLDADLLSLMHGVAERADLVRDGVVRAVQADRRAASFAGWYELFPRSQSGDAKRHGTFDDVIARLPAIKAMGFDVLYMTPIHPIGRVNRKGRNNALKAGMTRSIPISAA